MLPSASAVTRKAMMPFPSRERWHSGADEYSVVLLGVMYPIAVPKRNQRPQQNRPPVPQDSLINWRSTDLVFYDPILAGDIPKPDQSGTSQPDAERTRTSKRQKKLFGNGHLSRTASIEAVARDLVFLSLGSRTKAAPLNMAPSTLGEHTAQTLTPSPIPRAELCGSADKHCQETLKRFR